MSTDNKTKNIEDKLNDLIKRFEKFEEEIKNIIINEKTIVSEMANSIETKIDAMSCINTNKSKEPVKKSRSLTELGFLKKMMEDDENVYLNELYNDDDLNTIKNSDEVKKKKSEKDKFNKIISILVKDYINKDKTKKELLKKKLVEYLNE